MLDLMPDHQWRDLAACLDRDRGLFFDDGYASHLAARAICMECRVQSDCLTYAIDTDQPEGIWGGMSPRERRALLRDWNEPGRRASYI